jgi:hypothetical protein
MPRLRQEIAQKVADHLFAVESAIDVALTRAAELAAAMPQARTDARLPAMVGQEALDRASEAFMALVEARRRIIETHKSLDVTREQIGLREVNSGDTVPKPVPGGLTEGRIASASQSQLRAVA